MRQASMTISGAALMVALSTVPSSRAATVTDNKVSAGAVAKADVEACKAENHASDDKIIAGCTVLIGNEKTEKSDRRDAFIARAAAYDRKNQYDRVIADYSAALAIDPKLVDIHNKRGEAYRANGDWPHAITDFATAMRLDPQHPLARGNHKALAKDLERLGALMAVSHVQSFDCLAAKIAAEKAICADPALARLDREINAVYGKVIASAEASGGLTIPDIRDAQREFVTSRNASFGRPDYDLRKALLKRLESLLAIVR